MEEQHFNLAGLDAHESDTGVAVTRHQSCLYLPDCIFRLREEASDIVFGQKMMAGAD